MSEEIKEACHELIKAWEAISGGEVGKYHGNDFQQGLRTAYAQCAYELKEMLAGDREPATSKTPEPSTLASATGSVALCPRCKESPAMEISPVCGRCLQIIEGNESEHKGFWMETPAGNDVHILGNRRMPARTKKALGEMIDWAVKAAAAGKLEVPPNGESIHTART